MLGKATIKPILPLLSCTVLSACSLYPVVQESTGKDTYEIVRGVRCEARDAIVERFRGFLALKRYSDKIIYKNLTGDALSEKIYHNKIDVHEIDWQYLDKKLASNWMFYLRSSVSYEFLLDIEEKNDQSLNLNFNALRWGGLSKLPLGVGNSRTRQVQRNFRVYDTWYDLFIKQKWYNLCKIRDRSPNGEYPLAGYLNLEDMFKQFVNLNQSNQLAGNPTAQAVFSKDINDLTPTMADTIEFTTKVEANVDPAVIVGQTVGRYSLVDFGLKLDNYRQDHHKVIVVVSLPAEDGGFASVRAQLTAKGIAVESQRELSAAELTRQNEINFYNSVNRIATGAGSLLGR